MSQLQDVTERHRFDVARLADFLEDKLPDWAGPLDVKQFQGGQSNPTYLLTTPSRRYVMRSKPGPVAKLLPSAHAVEREFRVMRALGSQGIPVPKVYVLCEDESVIGRAFFVMEHVEGRILWDQSLPDSTRAERAAIYDEMNRVIAALHSVDVAAAGLSDYGKAGNYFTRQIARWTKQYQASITEPIEAMDHLIEWLPGHIPASARDDSQVAIVHGDFRLDNLVFHATEPRIVAVLDWELSTLGHPLSDLAYNCMPYRLPADSMEGFEGADLAALGMPSESEYLAAYCRRTGRDGIKDWDFYVAFSMFRLSAIAQGIMGRVVAGTANDPHARTRGARARPLADAGWALVQKL